MSTRLDEARDRLATLGQLEGVMGAMRGIAAARLRLARARLDGLQRYTDTVVVALADALAAMASEPGVDAGAGAGLDADADVLPVLAIVMCSEQGFVGGFNESMIDAARRYLADSPTARVLITGQRGAEVARMRGVDMSRALSMATRADAIPSLANALVELVGGAIAERRIRGVDLLHAHLGEDGRATITKCRLVPFDRDRAQRQMFPAVHTLAHTPAHTRAHTRAEASSRPVPSRPPRSAAPPLLGLPAMRLVERLAEEYLFAELCAALLMTHAAENAARMRAMVRAHANIERLIETGEAEYRRLRQAAITAEIAELAGGRRARSGRGLRTRASPPGRH